LVLNVQCIVVRFQAPRREWLDVLRAHVRTHVPGAFFDFDCAMHLCEGEDTPLQHAAAFRTPMLTHSLTLGRYHFIW